MSDPVFRGWLITIATTRYSHERESVAWENKTKQVATRRYKTRVCARMNHREQHLSSLRDLVFAGGDVDPGLTSGAFACRRYRD
ncbi:hypothetical protein [Aporhodopirellula aestuarii]|uniref:Uncharacterized protein n=1 Tax=Aporhodopirellula aestuarii TaxID=2950107 RepID=A0ABT0U8F5_9BACT|nr:hypothetical protein [Aporhodopirellula aestuarii]MCM2373173.1 hypothetical protein [Aporhodopirellula aestuarii]